MKVLAENVRQKLKVPCFYPPNHSVTIIDTLEDGNAKDIDIRVSMNVVKQELLQHQDQIMEIACDKEGDDNEDAFQEKTRVVSDCFMITE